MSPVSAGAVGELRRSVLTDVPDLRAVVDGVVVEVDLAVQGDRVAPLVDDLAGASRAPRRWCSEQRYRDDENDREYQDDQEQDALRHLCPLSGVQWHELISYLDQNSYLFY